MRIFHNHPQNWTEEERMQHLLGVHRRCVTMIGGSAGNPAGTLDTAVMYIFRNSWLSREVGVASAAAVVLFIITMILTAINNKVTSGD